MLLLLLSCLLPTASGKSCLHCWPELPAVVDYDLQVLWGSPGPPVELSQHHDHLEKEMARFFNHIDKAIMKFRDDKSLLLIEVDNYKKLFLERLRKISKGLKEKAPQSFYHLTSRAACNKSCVLHPDMEVINCVTCGHHQLSCNDSTLCPAWNSHVLIWIACVWIFLLMGAAAGGGYYYFYWLKKKIQQGEKVLDSARI
ncbi:testis-expressed protein 51 [Choloepus didactylus]|uniref:testis-expressed protein 51 n=1 Tax=Choloepus didactylus TaxID=27675 RepID=UPI00189D75C4|nr:testis-expressed protein 51 [Choloepus didactylus]